MASNITRCTQTGPPNGENCFDLGKPLEMDQFDQSDSSDHSFSLPPLPPLYPHFGTTVTSRQVTNIPESL